mmetsp:Transcript_2422/g.2710  ORF Transcript_2422/g.2710 Transcript_2422/m.2710 type:complete len:171 (-) Transcript_2422:52-564(-)
MSKPSDAKPTFEKTVQAARKHYLKRFGLSALPKDLDFMMYPKTLLCAANGDGELAPAERNHVIGVAASFMVPDAVIDFLETYEANDDVEELIKDVASVEGMSPIGPLIYHAIQASYADGTFHDDERAVVYKIGAKLGLKKQAVDDIIKLVEDEEAIRQRRIKLFSACSKK